MTAKQVKTQSQPQVAASSQGAPAKFPIIALGASAGGLEAFEQFFRAVPADSGFAYVLVSHLDPGHASLLSEILQRSAAMPVVEVEDQTPVAPNRVHVLPPNRDMSIFHGVLLLSLPDVPRGQRMPIDAFLRSLAEDQGANAVGIILSGTGTDGTLGLRAILGAGGITLVQDPTTAKYDGMPVSAIEAGFASRVVAPERMPEVLHQLLASSLPRDAPVTPAGGMSHILLLLRNSTGHDFSLYKKSTIGRRIERRMAQHEVTDLAVYIRYLKENPAEVRTLFKELLINVTSFFRDPEAFVTLKQDILPKLCAGQPDGYVFRVWVAGCASGEEAYSLAILLREMQEELWENRKQDIKIQLYATDLDDEAIALARTGLYPPNIAADVTPERLRRFFVKEDAGYRVKKDIREAVVFAVQNVIKDPPFTRLDLLSCRNLLIYLEPELQHRLLPTFHYALKPDGVLFLSPSESIGNHPELFAALSRKWKFYRAIHSANSARSMIASGLSWAASPGSKVTEETVKKPYEANFAELTRQMLMQSYAPASVVTDLKGNILFVHGETGKYLRPAPGQATLNVLEMAREGLQLELRNALHAEKATLNRPVRVRTDADLQPVSLSVRPMPSPEGLLLISFQDLPRDAPTRRRRPGAEAEPAPRVMELERDLAYTRENLQATIEEQQASNEELKSTNEELQSTNEELETSKEELQSLNEELVTVNAELQAKIEQLAGMQNDMKNLLDNIHIGTVFLDLNLRIRRYTREAVRAYRLIATDVGRPLADIKSNLEGVDVLADAQTVLETLVPRERELRGQDGEIFLVRVQPYRTLDNVIDGVVLTLSDISQRVRAEAAEREARVLAEAIVDTVREPLVVLDADLRVVSASRAFYLHFQSTPKETIGESLYEIGRRRWDIPELRDILENVLPGGHSFEDYVVDLTLPGSERRKYWLNARRVVGRDEARPLILLAMETTASPMPEGAAE
jgi:two-component system CheB/CheR fusion protein